MHVLMMNSIFSTPLRSQWPQATLALVQYGSKASAAIKSMCDCQRFPLVRRAQSTASHPIPQVHYPLLDSPLFQDLPSYYRYQVGIVPSIITPADHDLLVSICHRKLKRSAFLPAHFDKVISGYREMSASHWKVGVPASLAEENERMVRAVLSKCYAVLDQVRQEARNGGEGKMLNVERNGKWSQQTGGWLPEHILELNEKGTIGAHVDHLTASGTLVAALSLISSTPVVFQHVKHPEWKLEIQAEPGSLYFQMNDFRYDFTHAVPKPIGQPRISIMFRDQYVRQAGAEIQ